jgi:hypothetical protein
VAGGAPRSVPGLRSEDVVLAWSPDGNTLYLRVPGPTPTLQRLDVKTGAREKWREIRPTDLSGTSKIVHLYLTPDARYFAYTLERSFSELYLVDGLR